jgi:outer membrane receptor protein involved in Fe transport
VFTKFGWKNDNTSLKLSYSFADSDLNGNGATPMSMLARNWDSVYTYPDNTKNESHLLNLGWEHYFNDNVAFTGNTYYKNIKTKTYNGDVNDEAFSSIPNLTLTAGQQNTASGSPLGTYPSAGYSGAANLAYCIANNTGSASQEATEKCNGMINRTSTNQESVGAFAQVSVNNTLFNRPNTTLVGGGYEFSKSHFIQSAEFGSLQSGGGVLGSGYYATEYRTYPSNGDDVMDDRGANLKNEINTWSLFGADTLTLTDKAFLSASARYNHTDVKARDQNIHHVWNNSTNTITSAIDEDASLSGDHVFQRLNPSLGLTFKPVEGLVTYGNYNEGSRAPSAMELGCANPEAPCNLPNAMAGDPPLKQVVAKTFEAGFRGKTNSNFAYNVAAYTTQLKNDIQFISEGTKGYFANFGETRRRGVDIGLSKTFDNLTLAANYSYLDATFQSDETFMSNFNTSGTNVYEPAYTGATCDTTTGVGSRCESGRQIHVRKGNEIPGMPNNILKIFANYRVNDKLDVSANTITVGSVWAKGAENNDGAGASLPGYTLLNLAANFEATPKLTVYAKVNNVFDKAYYTGGMLGGNAFDANHAPLLGVNGSTTNGSRGYGNSSIETFGYAGAPRAAWVGVRYAFDDPKKAAK